MPTSASVRRTPPQTLRNKSPPPSLSPRMPSRPASPQAAVDSGKLDMIRSSNRTGLTERSLESYTDQDDTSSSSVSSRHDPHLSRGDDTPTSEQTGMPRQHNERPKFESHSLRLDHGDGEDDSVYLPLNGASQPNEETESRQALLGGVSRDRANFRFSGADHDSDDSENGEHRLDPSSCRTRAVHRNPRRRPAFHDVDGARLNDERRAPASAGPFLCPDRSRKDRPHIGQRRRGESRTQLSSSSNSSDALSPRSRRSCPESFKPASSESIHRPLTEDIVRAFLVDYYEDYNSIAPLKIQDCWETFYAKHYVPEFIMIRPSGNPITIPSLIDFSMSNDIQRKEMTLVSIDSIQLLADATVAVAVFTANQRFRFKGTENADQTVYTAVIESIDGEPKIVTEHRSTGAPIPTVEQRWQSNLTRPTSGSGVPSTEHRDVHGYSRGRSNAQTSVITAVLSPPPPTPILVCDERSVGSGKMTRSVDTTMTARSVSRSRYGTSSASETSSVTKRSRDVPPTFVRKPSDREDDS